MSIFRAAPFMVSKLKFSILFCPQSINICIRLQQGPCIGTHPRWISHHHHRLEMGRSNPGHLHCSRLDPRHHSRTAELSPRSTKTKSQKSLQGIRLYLYQHPRYNWTYDDRHRSIWKSPRPSMSPAIARTYRFNSVNLFVDYLRDYIHVPRCLQHRSQGTARMERRHWRPRVAGPRCRGACRTCIHHT